jgi:cysteinyl-tRNA synthetase
MAAGRCARVALLLAALLCSAQSFSPTAAGEARNPLLDVRSWAFLDQPERKEPAALDFDLLVLDPERGGKSGRGLERAELEELRKAYGGRRRILLARLGVGMAEPSRPYWKSKWNARPPAWIVPEPEERTGNHLVRYWRSEWRQFVFEGAGSRLERLLALGYDGVLLERVEAYGELERENSNARADMAAFLRALSAKARSLKGDVLIVLQNAEELASSPEVLGAIDGIAREDLLFGAEQRGGSNPARLIEEAVGHLKRVRDAARAVLVVEYLDSPSELWSALRELSRLDERFVPHFSERTARAPRPN